MTDAEGHRRAEISRVLWCTYVYGGQHPTEPGDERRCSDAIRAIQVQRHIAEDLIRQCQGRNKDFVREANAKILNPQRRALAIWTLLAAELVGWATTDAADAFGDMEEPERDRLEILGQIAAADTRFAPQHREAFSRLLLFVDRAAALRLREAINALGEGKVHPLLQPSDSGGHSLGSSDDELRLRALEHASYFYGYGLSKSAARARVGKAIGAAPETLRTWEERDLPAKMHDLRRILAFAVEAGRTVAARQADPDYENGPEKLLDASVQTVLDLLTAEPLAAFGRRYRSLSGSRHWGRAD